MFIQVINAKVVDAEGLKRQVERWEQEVRPGADGFLGSTSGVTEEGRLIVLARFDSEDNAQRNSERPEQSAWWAETEKMLTDATFKNSEAVVTMRGGGSDDAGFVQVMQGHITDPAKFDGLLPRMSEFDEVLSRHRPDVLGDVFVLHPDGTYTDAVYFTSESDARAAESAEMPAEMQAVFEEFMRATAIDEYLDLKDPKLT